MPEASPQLVSFDHPTGGSWQCGECQGATATGHLCARCGNVLCATCAEHETHRVPTRLTAECGTRQTVAPSVATTAVAA
jgi:hypothetical protein